VRLKQGVVNWKWDSMIAAHIIDNRGNISGLKFQTYVQFGVIDYDSEINPFLKSGSKDGANGINKIEEFIERPGGVEKVLEYCGWDTIWQYRLAMRQWEVPNIQEAYQLFHDGILALAKAEEQGFRIDIDYLEEKQIELTNQINELEQKFYASEFFIEWNKHSKETINMNSTKQLGDYLYKIKGYKPTKLTKTGKGSTDIEALQSLDIPALDLMLEKSKLEKIKNTYLEGFLREQVNGTIHPFFNLHLARTYRSSSNNPNFQNIPSRDKVAKKATRDAIFPRKGHQLLEIDFKGIEVAISACYHKDPTFLKYVRDTTTDMHGDMAEQLYLVDNFDKHKEEHDFLRKATKNSFVFPEFYGDYYKNCAEALAVKWCGLPEGNWKPGQGIEFEGANLSDHFITNGIKSFNKYIDHVKGIEEHFWKVRFPEYAAWKQRAYKVYQKYCYVPLKTGFTCRGIMDHKNVANYPIQGSAFHCLLWAFIQTVNEIEDKNMNSKVIGQIHDSIILDVHPDELQEVVSIVKRITTIDLPKKYDWIIVPLEVEAELCPVDGSWAEKEEFKI